MKKKKALINLGILFCFNILAWIGVFQINKANLEVIFFDVGQGDAIFVETPQNQQILIDGGPTSMILEKLGKEIPFWDRTIDLVILTHPDFDHLSGLIEVLQRYQVENILWTGVLCETAECREWQKLIEAEGANIHIAQAGQRIEGGGALINILYPFEKLEGETVKNTNNASIIAQFVYGENSFLLTGDASRTIEQELIKKGTAIDSDILKVGHHGSKNSNTEIFIEAVSPEIAVISVGEGNKYGHPDAQTLQNLQGIRILRTDLDGDIKIITDGKHYLVK